MSKSNQKQRTSEREKQLHLIIRKKRYRVHFVGVGGVSMYGLARLSHSMGAGVTGSDRASSDRLRALSLLGIQVFTSHRAENIGEAELVVYSHAVAADNPELVFARENGRLVVSRAEYLGALMLSYKTKIGVSGTHGKSTTTAMLEHIFSFSGANPTVLSGADLESGEPIREGGDQTLIYEACEYRDSFLSFSPSVAVALNLELDHTDYFADISALRSSFTKALARASEFALVCSDDENLSKILPALKKKTKTVTFGMNPGSDYSYFINSFNERGFEFTVSHCGLDLSFELNIPGVHNVSNAVAAIAVALELGISADDVKRALSGFVGIPRRLEIIGSRHGRTVYFDYAHHPTEIIASISAIKLVTREPLTVVFKPHTYTRTASLWDSFCSSLSLADRVILTDIYPAREEPIEGVNSKRLAEDIGDRAEYSPDSEVVFRLDEQHDKGAIVLMGAGDFDNIKYDILNK